MIIKVRRQIKQVFETETAGHGAIPSQGTAIYNNHVLDYSSINLLPLVFSSLDKGLP